jgi:hypothetical protein
MIVAIFFFRIGIEIETRIHKIRILVTYERRCDGKCDLWCDLPRDRSNKGAKKRLLIVFSNNLETVKVVQHNFALSYPMETE